MKSGCHDHYCPKCKHGFLHWVMGCKWEFETLCLDHRVQDFLLSRAEEQFAETGKWPGES